MQPNAGNTALTEDERLRAIHRDLGIADTYAADRGFERHHEAEADALVAIGLNDEGREISLTQPAAMAWIHMRDAAHAAGVELIPISGFRSIARQTEIIRDKLAAGIPLDAILRYVAAPGFSEHHTGRAIDVGSPEHIELDEQFARTAAFAWLATHAAKFGFRLTYPRENRNGIGYEPWHWCWHEHRDTSSVAS